MGKQQRKKPQKRQKVSKFIRTCERCGNENFSRSKVFRCEFCNKLNGVIKDEQRRIIETGKTDIV